MIIRDIQLPGKKVAMGIEVPLADASLVLITASRGYLMCGYLSIDTAEKMGDCAAVIKGVKSIEDMLEGKVVEVTAKARRSGIRIGMTGLKALSKIS